MSNWKAVPTSPASSPRTPGAGRVSRGQPTSSWSEKVKSSHVFSIVAAVCLASTAVRAEGCEDIVARHMVGEAMLAANYVAAAEKAGMKPAEIKAALKAI